MIGNGAQVVGKGAIQLGDGVNELPYTFSVGLNGQNYTLLDEAGMIPLERLGFADTKFVIDTSTISGSHSIFGGTIEGGALTALAIGDDAQASGLASIAVGTNVQASGTDSIAVGTNAQASDSGAVGLGKDAKAVASDAIQLGAGTNSEAKTFQVGNYKLLGSDGKIPAERLPFTGDVLTNTATGSGSVSTGGAGPVTTSNAIAIGDLASAQNGGISLGSASGALSGGVSVGTQSSASDQAVVIGAESSARGLSSIAIGSFASADADYAIQLGKGDNNEANTLSVGLSDTANYKLLGADGKIPAERLPFTGEVLTNTATGDSSFSTGGAEPVVEQSSTAIGVNADANFREAVAVGMLAVVGGDSGTAIGTNAQAYQNALAIGKDSGANENATAIGSFASAGADYAIQLGTGENSEANTFSVGLSDTANYKLLGADGKIPVERLPNGILANTAASEGFSTIPAAPAGPRSVALGSNAQALGDNAVAVGYNVRAAQGALAIGLGANAGNTSIALGQAADASTGSGVAIGMASTVGGGATAVGTASQASAEYSVAIGSRSAASATRAIQIGQGTNSEANTLKVGLSDMTNVKLLGSDGKIPAERLPAATASTLGGVKSGGDISISSTGAVSVVSALKAVQDANGANIAATYATKNSVEDLQANKVKVDWTTSNVNKVLVIGSDSNYPDVYGKVTVAKITENFLDNAIKNKLSNAVTSVATSGSGAVVTGFSKSGNSMTVTKSNVKIPVGSATATTYATIWVE